MARSSYIYVVMRGADIVGAFTVKHELVSWLRRTKAEYRVWRMPDNFHNSHSPVEITGELGSV